MIIASLAITGLLTALQLSANKTKKIDLLEQAHIASAPQKAKEIFLSEEEYALPFTRKQKIIYFFVFLLLPPIAIIYFITVYRDSRILFFVLLILSVPLYAYIAFKIINLIKNPIIHIKNSGIDHYSKSFKWSFIGEISLLKLQLNVSPYRLPHFLYFIELSLHTNKKQLFDFITLPLPTDEFNATIAIEYAKAYAIKERAPLIELKREHIHKLYKLETEVIPNTEKSSKEIDKLSRELYQYDRLKNLHRKSIEKWAKVVRG
jgi:hypothetical protein